MESKKTGTGSKSSGVGSPKIGAFYPSTTKTPASKSSSTAQSSKSSSTAQSARSSTVASKKSVAAKKSVVSKKSVVANKSVVAKKSAVAKKSVAPKKVVAVKKSVGAKKSGSKSAPVGDSDVLAASVNTPAKMARRQELCGSRPGGADAYHYGERCLLKHQLNTLMEKNRRAAAFVGSIKIEMPILEKEIQNTKIDNKDLQVVLIDVAANNALTQFMTDPENMEIYPSPVDRFNGAVSKLSGEHKNIAKYPSAFKKNVFYLVHQQFESMLKNINGFKGRRATNKGVKSV